MPTAACSKVSRKRSSLSRRAASARFRSVMSMPAPTRQRRPSNSTRRPVKKYGMPPPSRVRKRASTEDSPSANTSPIRARTRSRSSGAMKSSGCMRAISSPR